jgi:hypothetical protein
VYPTMRFGGRPGDLATNTARPVSRSRPTVRAESSNDSPTGMSLMMLTSTSSETLHFLFPAAASWFLAGAAGPSDETL